MGCLTCQDQGIETPMPSAPDRPRHLKADPQGLDPSAHVGRGLAMVNALTSEWGDNGLTQSRQVWFHLPYDQTHTHWGQLEQDR